MKLIREQFSLLFDFLRNDLKRILLVTVIACITVCLIGCIVGIFSPEWCNDLMHSFNDSVVESGVKRPDGSVSVFTLMAHNWVVALTMAATGCIPFLFIPLIYLISNFLLIGVAAAVYIHNNLSPVLFLAGIVPHGIFELTAIILALACGVYLCLSLSQMILKRPKAPFFADMLSNVLRVMLLITAPFLIPDIWGEIKRERE